MWETEQFWGTINFHSNYFLTIEVNGAPKQTVTNLQTCSPMDPLQWMGAVRMRVQTAVTNITIIHTTPVLQLTSCAVKRCVFVINNASLRLLNFKLSILAKIWVHNTEKVHLLLSTNIKIHPHMCLELFWLVYSVWSVHISLLIQMRQLFHWRKCYYGLVLYPGGFVSYKHTVFHFTRY